MHCILIINHVLKDYVNEEGTKKVLLYLVVLVEVLVHLYLCLNIFQMVLLHLVVLVAVCAY